MREKNETNDRGMNLSFCQKDVARAINVFCAFPRTSTTSHGNVLTEKLGATGEGGEDEREVG